MTAVEQFQLIAESAVWANLVGYRERQVNTVIEESMQACGSRTRANIRHGLIDND
jgi:adenosylmethionine-8-amino-7-oxononanoate aminotransferase